MTLWPVTSPSYPSEVFGSVFPPETVLFDYDGPSIFVFRTPHGVPVLAYLCDEDETTLRYIAAPTSPQIIERLQTGVISIRTALEQPPMWILDASLEGTVQRAWVTLSEDLPDDALPEPHVLLYPELQPVLKVRLIGDPIKEGNVPGNVIKQAITTVEGTLKKLVDYVLERESTGRPPDELRGLYALSAQQFAFTSFEIAFREPSFAAQQELALESRPDPRKVFDRVAELFARGVRWAADQESLSLSPLGDSTEQQRVVLQAIRQLTPPLQGVISSIEVGGRMIGTAPGQPIRLGRNARRKVSTGLKQIQQARVEVVDTEGAIRELDLDKLGFTLRQLLDGAEQQCRFPSELLDDVRDAFDDGYRVRVVGTRSFPTALLDVVLVIRVESPG